MADAIISQVVERIATIFEDKIRYGVNLVRGVKDEFLYLSGKLKTIQMVLDDAEKRGVNDQSVKSWLKKLEAIAYEIVDILDEWSYYLLKDEMEGSPEPEPKQKIGCSFIKSSCLSFKKVSVRRDIAKKIENVKAMLEQIYKEKNAFNFVISPPTTRNEGVGKMMGIYHPEELSLDECWSLLRATSLAGKSEIWQLNIVELFPHLVLNYNELSPVLKRCFSYCAVYPKDHQIHAGTLIEEWMAQGYLGSDSGNGAVELKGQENLRNLAMRYLIQDIEKSESGEEIKWCKMHDTVHDFALFLRKNDDKERSCQVCDRSLASQVQEYRSLSWDYETPVDERDRSYQVCDCMKSLRVLRIKRLYNNPFPLGMETLIHLRWLEIHDVALSKDDLEIICRLYFLQTLVLSLCKLTEIPREIGKLVHLRRLDLRANKELKELSESMYSLVELRSLSLAWCSLKEIQKEIGKLVKLRELDLSSNSGMELPESIRSLVELQILKIKHTYINCLPEALGELSNLRKLELYEFKVGSECNKLGFLKKICRHLIGSLVLDIHCSSMCEMKELVEDAEQAELETVL